MVCPITQGDHNEFRNDIYLSWVVCMNLYTLLQCIRYTKGSKKYCIHILHQRLCGYALYNFRIDTDIHCTIKCFTLNNSQNKIICSFPLRRFQLKYSGAWPRADIESAERVPIGPNRGSFAPSRVKGHILFGSCQAYAYHFLTLTSCVSVVARKTRGWIGTVN